MAHIGFLCPPIAGHLNASATLARTLTSRGHRASAFQLPEARASIEAQQLEFVPLGTGGSDTRAVSEAVAKLGSLAGLNALRFSVECCASLARTMCEHGPAAIGRSAVDLLVVDQNEPAGATVAQHLEIPFVSMASGLPLNREAAVPPPFVPWTHSHHLPTKLLNTATYAVFDRIVAPVNRVLNAYRREWRLAPIRTPDDTFSDLAQISQLTEDFDFPRASKPPSLHYVGPLRDDHRPTVPFPYEQLNGKPLVYASLGTLQNRRPEIFRAIAAACERLDVQLVISTGGAPLALSGLPGSPIVVRYAPQWELLDCAAACVTHGGLNTVMEALSCGVPLVVLPVTNDQPAVAARVRTAGAGEVIGNARVSADRVLAALRRVLGDPSCRRHAQRLKESIVRAGGAARAADIVEAVLART